MPLELFRASDGAAFYLRRVAPAQPRPLARLIVLPGVRSHGGWYGGSANAWASEGLEVLTLDRRGTGLNTARRGDAPGFRRLIDDVAEVVRAEHATRPWLPTFVVGVSWGGKLAAALPYRHPWLAAGLVLVTPGLRPKIRPPLARRLRILAARLLRPRKLFPIPLNEPELFTASPDWRAFLAANPHDLREATARFLVASTMLDVYLRRASKAVRLPVLTLLAGRDRIIDNAATREYLRRFPSPDLSVIEYPGAEHTLEFEGPACPFAADVAAWVKARAGFPVNPQGDSAVPTPPLRVGEGEPKPGQEWAPARDEPVTRRPLRCDRRAINCWPPGYFHPRRVLRCVRYS